MASCIKYLYQPFCSQVALIIACFYFRLKLRVLQTIRANIATNSILNLSQDHYFHYFYGCQSLLLKLKIEKLQFEFELPLWELLSQYSDHKSFIFRFISEFDSLEHQFAEDQRSLFFRMFYDRYFVSRYSYLFKPAPLDCSVATKETMEALFPILFEYHFRQIRYSQRFHRHHLIPIVELPNGQTRHV